MSGPLRSKQGCWTCRLRKKKCDERRPHCATCESLSITCHGFGPKPDWMNSGEERRVMASQLAEMARSKPSARKTTPRPSREPGQLPQLAPKGAGAGTGTPSSPPPQPASQQQNQPRPAPPDSLNSPSEGDVVAAAKPWQVSPTADEYVLLMHFLDSVCELQLPLYNPDIMYGGRGWILSMLLHTKPLYHAVLAMSTYHRRMVMVPRGTPEWQAEDVRRQEEHVAICLDLVHQAANGPCSNDSTRFGVAACILQLLFVDLFTNNRNRWQAHLRVLTEMLQRVHENKFVNIGLSEESRVILLSPKSFENHGAEVREELMAFRAFGASVVWLDILFSVTTGTAPSQWIETFFSSDPDCHIQLQDIMGCQNWVMVQIGRITKLYSEKMQAAKLKPFDSCTELVQTAQEIEKDIQHGLAQGALSSMDCADHAYALVARTSSRVVPITCIYAHTALIYLHLVIHGFTELRQISDFVSRVTTHLRCVLLSELRPTLVMPIYICGSVAEESDRDFFREVLSTPPLMDPALPHRARVLQGLEEIWIQRQIRPVCTWEDCLALISDILLH